LLNASLPPTALDQAPPKLGAVDPVFSEVLKDSKLIGLS
jgi:hypothetical protein